MSGSQKLNQARKNSLGDSEAGDVIKSVTDSGIGSTQPSSQESNVTDPFQAQKEHPTSYSSLTLPTLEDFGIKQLPVSEDSQSLEARYACANIQIKDKGASILDMYSKTESSTQVTRSNSDTIFSGLDDPCMICLSRPKTASLIHGLSGHQVCCFTCAKRLKRRGQDCPVCRRSIQKVVRNYIL